MSQKLAMIKDIKALVYFILHILIPLVSGDKIFQNGCF